MSKKKKVRVELRKNRTKPPRPNDWTRNFADHGYQDEKPTDTERVRAKGDLSRHRTIIADEANSPAVNADVSLPGRVLRVHGLFSIVETTDGRLFRCAVRRLLKSLQSDARNVVACGDRVWFRRVISGVENPPDVECELPIEESDEPSGDLDLPTPLPEGLIERVEPRHGTLTRLSRRREHVLVANVDQLLIVMSLFEPDLKPHLIDRYTAAAFQGGLQPIICLNKSDLAEVAAFQPLLGHYWQLGIPTFLTSAQTGQGIAQLRQQLHGRSTVLSGQSGVGKTSLLNAIQPGLALSVKSVSAVNQKGRHTTTYAQLIRLDFGGWVVDTPGVRQLQLWDVRPEEVEGYFPDLRPFVALCRYPDCTHTHEDGCAVKRAVRFGQIGARRYHSYLGLFNGSMEA
jgi:ribosome biogenesis GTPase